LNKIFVFGSNLEGRHGKGAALYAKQYHGAKSGIGYGHVGNSFAIPTKSTPYKSLSLSNINKYVHEFIEYAKATPELIYNITRIGCGLAGYKDIDIAPMFKDAPPNCLLPHEWVQINGRNYQTPNKSQAL